MVNEPSFILNKNNGGMNWGYCVEKPEDQPFKYFAIVETSTIEGSETKYIFYFLTSAPI